MNRPETRGKPALTMGELDSFLRAEFPQMLNGRNGLSIEEIWHGGAQVRQAFREAFIRPGGTISGPTMMALADVAIYIAVLTAIGPVPLAVTTQLSINFLRKPAAAACEGAASNGRGADARKMDPRTKPAGDGRSMSRI
jgi:acyl-coenzyme A thioesterase PaaI-like protein